MKKILFLMLATVISFSIFGAVQTNQPVNAEPGESQIDGLVGWWNFNDSNDSLADDTSGNGNGGTLNNMSPANYVTDVPAVCEDSNLNALSLNSGGQEDQQWVEVGSHDELRPTSLTISAWIKATDGPYFSQIAGAAGLTKGSVGYGLFYSAEYDVIQFDSLKGYVSYSVSGEGNIEGQWVHVSATYDETSGDTTLYLNGTQVAYYDNDPGALEHELEYFENAPYDFEIGRAQNTDLSDAGYFQGLIDDVRVYNRALTSEEVAALSAEGDCGNLPQDLNGDEIDDSEQPNVGGYVSSYTGKTVAIDVGSDCELTTDDMTQESSLAIQDAAYDYVNGLWEWEADCVTNTTTIKLYYYDVSVEGLVARKFSKRTNSFFTLDGATLEQRTINGASVAVVTYQITDNSALDMNLDLGTIEDPVGLGQSILGAPRTGAGGTAK